MLPILASNASAKGALKRPTLGEPSAFPGLPGVPEKSDAAQAAKGLGGVDEGVGDGDAPGEGLRLGVGVGVAAGHVIARKTAPAPPSATHTTPVAGSRAIP
jgi:class 3 adenylate cyclase